MYSPHEISAAIKVSPTPFYLYSQAKLLEQCQKAKAMPTPYGHKVRYAIKAAGNRNLLRLMLKQGLYFDASSEWEALRMLKIGIPGNKIMLTAQQTAQDPQYLLSKKVTLNACSLQQTNVYSKAAAKKKMPISLRVNPGGNFNFPFKTNVSGVNSSFGIWHEEIKTALQIATKAGARIETLHSHIGSGSSKNPWIEATKRTIIMLNNMPHVKTLSIGGGFKVDRIGNDHSNITSIGNAISPLIKKHYQKTGVKLTLEIEPGTFLVAQTAALITSIDDIVNTGKNGHTFCKLNAGMNDYLRCSLYGAQHKITHLQHLKKELQVAATTKNKVHAILVGHCCENSDIFTPTTNGNKVSPMESLPLKNPQINDILMLHHCGAYGASMASNYNSFPLIPELLLGTNGKIITIRKSQSLKQLLANEINIIK